MENFGDLDDFVHEHASHRRPTSMTFDRGVENSLETAHEAPGYSVVSLQTQSSGLNNSLGTFQQAAPAHFSRPLHHVPWSVFISSLEPAPDSKGRLPEYLFGPTEPEDLRGRESFDSLESIESFDSGYGPSPMIPGPDLESYSPFCTDQQTGHKRRIYNREVEFPEVPDLFTADQFSPHKFPFEFNLIRDALELEGTNSGANSDNKPTTRPEEIYENMLPSKCVISPLDEARFSRPLAPQPLIPSSANHSPAILQETLEAPGNELSSGSTIFSNIDSKKPLAETTPYESTDDMATVSSSSGSLDLTVSAAMSLERKREIIMKVMETFDELYSRSPGSWYSDGLDEDEEDTDYGSESSWSQTTVETTISPETLSTSFIRCNTDRRDAPQQNDGSSNVETGNCPASSVKPGSEKHNSKQESAAEGKRKIGDSQGDEENEENEDRRKRQRTPGPGRPSQSANGRKFACPYTKRWPNRTPKVPSCVFPGFPTIARLKGHLYRAHMRPLPCFRCYETFLDESALRDHQNAAERCNQNPNIPEIEGVTPDQEKQLKSKKRSKGDDNEEKKWECVYRILFPGVTEIPSPYCDFDPQLQYSQMSPGSENLLAFEQFSRENLRGIVQRRLEMQMEREEIILEERLRSMMFDIMRMAQEDMLGQWRSSLNRSGRSRETGIAPEQQLNATSSTALHSQESAADDISNIVVPPPSTDYGDAREAMAELPVNKPGPADSGFFSFGTSSNTSEHLENGRIEDTPPSSQPIAPLDQYDQRSPTVADDSQSAGDLQELATNSFEIPAGADLGFFGLGESTHDTTQSTVAYPLVGNDDDFSFDLDFPWDFSNGQDM